MASETVCEVSVTEEFIDLKTPWIPYPNRCGKSGIDIFSEYNNLVSLQDYYVSEAKSLSTFVSSKVLDSDYDFVFVATGAVMDDFYAQSVDFPSAMERIRTMDHKIQEIWWRLMFPYQLEKFKSDNPHSKILILIIAPDTHFNPSNSKYHHPRFMDYFNTYGWYHVERNAWNSKDDDIEVRLFNCPVPGFSSTQNLNIEHQKIRLMGRLAGETGILDILDRLKNTRTDYRFVKSFYENLDALFHKTEDQDGLIMCINGAVINTRDERCYLGRSYFIKDLCSLFSEDTKKRLLGSWVYLDSLAYFCIILDYQLDEARESSFIKPSDDQTGDLIYLLPTKTEYYHWCKYCIDDLVERVPYTTEEIVNNENKVICKK